MRSTSHLDTNDTTHIHRRAWRVCPALMPPPLKLTKPGSIWMHQFAEAVLHEETWIAFVAAHGDQFEYLTVQP